MDRCRIGDKQAPNPVMNIFFSVKDIIITDI